MEILEFVKGDRVDPVYMESSYYIAPDEGGEKPYALLFEAYAPEWITSAGEDRDAQPRARVILRPGTKGIMLHTMYYADEVRQGGRVPYQQTDSG